VKLESELAKKGKPRWLPFERQGFKGRFGTLVTQKSIDRHFLTF